MEIKNPEKDIIQINGCRAQISAWACSPINKQ